MSRLSEAGRVARELAGDLMGGAAAVAPEVITAAKAAWPTVKKVGKYALIGGLTIYGYGRVTAEINEGDTRPCAVSDINSGLEPLEEPGSREGTYNRSDGQQVYQAMLYDPEVALVEAPFWLEDGALSELKDSDAAIGEDFMDKVWGLDLVDMPKGDLVDSVEDITCFGPDPYSYEGDNVLYYDSDGQNLLSILESATDN